MEALGVILAVVIGVPLSIWMHHNSKAIDHHRRTRDADRPLGMDEKEWARKRENARRNERRKAQKRRRS